MAGSAAHGSKAVKSSDDSLVFPSGRSVSRARQDAKGLAKAEGIPLSEALDRVAFQNTRLLGFGGWAEILKLLRSGDLPNAFPMAIDRAPKGAELDIFSMARQAPGEYPWDHWRQLALERGVPAILASLGRDVMREHFNHAWPDYLAVEVSMHHPSAPRRMIEGALNRPEATGARWTWLLNSDGERVTSDREMHAPVIQERPMAQSTSIPTLPRRTTMTNAYLDGLELVKQHSGTSGQRGLAKCILSLYNDVHAFSMAEILGSLDERYTKIVLAMVNAYADEGETEELRRAGKWVYENFPGLVELSNAMRDARSAVRAEWERQREEENRRLYPDG